MTSVISPRVSRSKLLLLALIPFFSFTGTAQSEFSDSQVKAFPNPSDGTITLESKIPLDQLEAILVTDMRGKVVHGYSLETGETTLRLFMQDQPAGNYMVHLLYREWDEQVQVSKY